MSLLKTETHSLVSRPVTLPWSGSASSIRHSRTGVRLPVFEARMRSIIVNLETSITSRALNCRGHIATTAGVGKRNEGEVDDKGPSKAMAENKTFDN